VLPRVSPMGITHPTSFGLVDHTPVFMDIAEDFYFRLEPDRERAFLASLKKSERQIEPIVHGLVRGLEREDWSIESVPLPSPPKRALPGPRNLGFPNLLEVVAVARLLLAVRQALRTRPIGDILESLAGKAGRSSAADPIALAIAFRNARRLVPVRANCLSDSLALMRWLAGHGEGATLVFGVKLDPFAAHCWVQSGDVLLNDRPERVERFARVRTISCTPATP
jgi:Transglutaminase-like superfamily